MNIKVNLYEIGKLLAEAKKVLMHGEFQQWIEQHFEKDLPYSTAAAYMAVYEHFKASPKVVRLLPLNFLMDMTRKSFPEEIRNTIEKFAQDLDPNDVRAIQDLHARYKEGAIDLNEFMSLANKLIELGIAIEKGQTEKRISRNSRRTLEYGFSDIIKAIRSFRKKAIELGNLYPAVEDSEAQKLLLTDIDNTIAELQKLRSDVEHGEGFFQSVIHPLFGKQLKANL